MLCEANWASYVQQNNVPVIGAEPIDALYNTNPVFFPSTATVDVFLWSFVEAAKLVGDKSFAWMTCVESAGCQIGTPIAQAASKSLGLPFFTRSFSTSSPSFAAECVAAEQFGSKYGGANQQGVFVALANPRFADQCGQQGYNPTYIQNIGGDWNTYVKLIATDPHFNNAAAPMDMFPWWLQVPQTANFRAAMSQYMPNFPNYGPTAAEIWMDGLVFQAGAQHMSASPTRQALLAGLYSIHNESVGGLTPPLNFVQGQPKDVRCFYVARIEDGKGTGIYSNLVAPNGLTPTCEPLPTSSSSPTS
jgi:branched-chain amino acid transport system substrate-binding protein